MPLAILYHQETNKNIQAATPTHFLLSTKLKRVTAFFAANKSNSAHTKYTPPIITIGTNKRLMVAAPTKSNWLAKINALVKPQAGQGIPRNIFGRHGIKIGVLTTTRKINPTIA